MGKKKAAPPEAAGESAPAWIVSFADLVTLMMSFFVVLYALKQGGKKQRLQTAAAIKARFGYVPPLNSKSPLDLAVLSYLHRPAPRDAVKHPGRTNRIITGARGLNRRVKTIRTGKEITTGGQITFHRDSSVLTRRDDLALRRLAAMLRGHSNVLIVKGNVSADELALRPQDRNGMGLSYQRAMAVCNALAKLGIRRRALRPEACGPFEPLHPHAYTAAALRANRRVEIYTTEKTVNEFDPKSYVSAAEK